MASRALLNFGNTLKELRIHFCQKSAASQGLRDFVNKYYAEIKSNNPSVQILVRECEGVTPRIWARYEYGRESCVEVPDRSPQKILEEVSRLGTFAGKS